jgi:predicted dinucleotide-binding enzyme
MTEKGSSPFLFFFPSFTSPKRMQIAIIGAGHVGRALALGLSAAGHQVWLGVRHPDSQEIKTLLEQAPALQVSSVEDASQVAEVLIFSAPAQATQEITEQLGDVSEKVIIDAMNALRAKPEPYPTTFAALKDWTNCHHLVKCFNSTGYENLTNPVYNGIALDMFMAGSSQKAKDIARQLALDIGFAECYDFGGDDKVSLLESFAMVWINLAIMQGHGRDLGFKLLRRNKPS